MEDKKQSVEKKATTNAGGGPPHIDPADHHGAPDGTAESPPRGVFCDAKPPSLEKPKRT